MSDEGSSSESQKLFLRRSFSISNIMFAMVVAAIFSAALFQESPWWRATLGTITLAMILNGMLAGIFARGERRVFGLSFFLGAVFFAPSCYTFQASLPFMITSKLLEIARVYTARPINTENFYIVAVIFWLQLTCFAAGFAGLYWHRSSKKSDALSP